jgi:DNA repair protein RecO (recombination protein O)
MHQITSAIAIKTIKYGDSSLITNCYTEKFGLKGFILKGIVNSKNKKGIRKSLFQPLTLLEIVITEKSSQKLSFLKEAKLETPYSSIPFDFKKKSILFFISEFLYQVLQEERGENQKLFEYIKKALIWLDSNNNIGNFPIKFMIDISKFLGFQPNVENKKTSYFDMENGYSTNGKPNGKFIEGKQKMLMTLFLGTNFDNLNFIKLSKTDKSELLENTLDYFQLHLQRFKKPKSTSILNELFSPI